MRLKFFFALVLRLVARHDHFITTRRYKALQISRTTGYTKLCALKVHSPSPAIKKKPSATHLQKVLIVKALAGALLTKAELVTYPLWCSLDSPVSAVVRTQAHKAQNKKAASS